MDTKATGEEILIPLQNSMTGRYQVVGQDTSSILSEIIVKIPKSSDTLAEITPRVGGNNDIYAELLVKHGGKSDVLAEIQPIGGHNIPAIIEVPDGNRMVGLFEVQEPPRLTTSLNPARDAFTRETSPYDVINYGGNNSLTVGRYGEEIYRSYVYFSLSDWAAQNVIIEAKLRLHYIGEIPPNSKLEILTVDRFWSELGITHKNRPSPVEIVANTFTNNPAEKYVEFNFTGVTSSWIKQTISNNGFVIRATNESVSELISFRSRESTRPPELIITYYDNRVYSTGRTQVPAELFVRRVGSKDVLAEVDVLSTLGIRDILAEMYVHRYEDPVDREIEAEITVTRKNLPSELSVSVYGEGEVLAEVSARSLVQYKTKEAELTVSKPFQDAEIFVSFNSDIETELVVQRREVSSIESEINITRWQVDSEIFVKHKRETLAEITIEAFKDSDTPSEIAVSRESVLSEIFVRCNSDIETEITVSRRRESDTYAELTVTKEYVLASVTVVETSHTEAEVFVKHIDDVLVEINVHIHDSVEAEIDVIKASKIPAEITITKTSIHAEIMIPYWDDSDVLAEVSARVLRVSDVLTEINVRTISGGAYAFII